MASQQVLHDASVAATAQMQDLFSRCWLRFIQSIRLGRPVMFLPKSLGDQIGEPGMEAMALRFSILIQDPIYIQYNPRFGAYCMGALENIPFSDQLRILTLVSYKRTNNVFPFHENWVPSIPTASDVVVAPATAAPTAALVSTARVPKSANSFILFRRDKYAEFCSEHPDEPKIQNKEFSGIAAEMWKNATPEVKEHYAQLARELKQQAEEANNQLETVSRRSAKNKRQSLAPSEQLSGESSGESPSGHPSSNALSGI